MFERFASGARAIVTCSVEEAGVRGDRRVGTDHLLLGALHDAGIARAVGVEVAEARAAADELDRAALASVGIDLEGFTPPVSISRLRRVPFSSGSKDVMGRMLAHATSEKAKSIEPRHLLLALLDRQQPDPAAALLEALHVDRAAVRERLES